MKTRYPDYIMQLLRQREGLEPDDVSHDAQINELSPDEAFSEVCLWEGFIGYDSTIKGWIADIYGINLNAIGGRRIEECR